MIKFSVTTFLFINRCSSHLFSVLFGRDVLAAFSYLCSDRWQLSGPEHLLLAHVTWWTVSQLVRIWQLSGAAVCVLTSSGFIIALQREVVDPPLLSITSDISAVSATPVVWQCGWQRHLVSRSVGPPFWSDWNISLVCSGVSSLSDGLPSLRRPGSIPSPWIRLMLSTGGPRSEPIERKTPAGRGEAVSVFPTTALSCCCCLHSSRTYFLGVYHRL